MKRKKEAVADPIEPVHANDSRPAVRDLIATHRDAIDKAKSEISQHSLYEPRKHDDLWILRFILSKKRHKKVVETAISTLEYRHKGKLDERDIRFEVPGSASCKSESVNLSVKYADPDTFLWCLPQQQGNIFLFCRYSGYDQHATMENIDEKHWIPLFGYLTEWSFQWCDYVTRTTGRLTKNVRCVDFVGMKLSQINRELSNRDSAAMKATEHFYPQLLEKIFICHFPSWMLFLWRFLRHLLPKSVTEKVDFVSPKTSKSDVKRILKYIDIAYLPERFGGNYTPWPVDYGLPK